MAVNIIFKGGQTETLREEFTERERYKRLVNVPGQIDTLYESRYYGLLDKEFNPVYVVDEPRILTQIENNSTGEQVLGFVGKAFQNFKQDYLARISASNRSLPEGLPGINIIRGYQNFSQLYNAHLSRVAIHYSEFLKRDVKITDFASFLARAKELFADTLHSLPVTRSGFLLSDFNEVYSTGLAFDLADDDFDTDQQKGIIIQSEDFKCYCDYAQAAGFRVDKNVPWRLYVDLESDIMKKMIRGTTPAFMPPDRHSSLSAEDIMNQIYREKSSNYDMYDLEDFLETVYNEILDSKPQIKGTFRRELDSVPREWLIDNLLKVRLYEFGIYDEHLHRKQTEENLEIYKIYGVEQVIGKIGHFCKGKFAEIIS